MTHPAIQTAFDAHEALLRDVRRDCIVPLSMASTEIRARLAKGRKILLFGNGGSAADAQHLAAELVGRFKRDRPAIRAVSLATDTSALTAIGNDFGFDRVFARQVEALAEQDDVVIALSTSGRSRNVLDALRVAEALGCWRLGLTGGLEPNPMQDVCDASIRIPHTDTARIQEMHILLGHLLCELIEGDGG